MSDYLLVLPSRHMDLPRWVMSKMHPVGQNWSNQRSTGYFLKDVETPQQCRINLYFYLNVTLKNCLSVFLLSSLWQMAAPQ